jgi:hypothetical protein
MDGLVDTVREHRKLSHDSCQVFSKEKYSKPQELQPL